MSRLRRLFITGKIFFVTCNVLPARTAFAEPEFEILAKVFDAIRDRRRFLLGGYVFMPDHWHALVFPSPRDTLPRLMGALKVASMRLINGYHQRRGNLWQPRYHDHAIRTVKEFRDALGYMHLNPVRRGLVQKPEDWPWSSVHAFGRPGPLRLRVDDLNLPAEATTRL
jgi:putative transposase